MAEILIFRHVANEGPGYLADFLEHRHISYRMIAIDADDAVPDSIEGIAGLVFMGGPMSVNDDLPWIEQEIKLIRQALEQDLPMLGHCLGGQLMAKAMGATISANTVAEYGWLPVEVMDNNIARDWFADIAPRFDAFHWHGETFDLPTGTGHVLASEHCRNQGFVMGKSLALQCHIEMTRELVEDWVSHTDDATLTPTPSIQNRQQMLNGLDDKIAHMQASADILYSRWLTGLL